MWGFPRLWFYFLLVNFLFVFISSALNNVFKQSSTRISIKNMYSLYTVFKIAQKNTITFFMFVYLLEEEKKRFNETTFFILIYFFYKTNKIAFFVLNCAAVNGINNGFLKKIVSCAATFKTLLVVYTKLSLVGVYGKGCSLYNVAKNKSFVNITKKLVLAPKLSSSSVYKNISVFNSHNMEFFYLRKSKVYNKGRYSRCRQNYRTGVYLCMYLSIVCIFGLYFWFLKFSFSFTYLWWFFIAFVGSFLLPKIIKYRLYEPVTTLSKVFGFFR